MKTETEWGDDDAVEAAPETKPTAQAPVAAVAQTLAAKPAAVVEAEEVFPSGFKESLVVLQECERDYEASQGLYRNQNARAVQIRTLARLRAIRRHCWNLQQVPTAPTITADDQAEFRQGQNHVHIRKGERLQELADKHPSVAAILPK